MHIFISYAKVDTYDLARKLHTELNALSGVTAWMDESLETGDSWAWQIQHQIDSCAYMLVLLSPDVNRDPYGEKGRSFVLNEIDYARQGKKPIIPIMAQTTNAPVQIAGIEYINFAQNSDMGMQRLLKEINRKMPAVGRLPIEDTTSKPIPVKAKPSPAQNQKQSSSRRRVPAIIVAGLYC